MSFFLPFLLEQIIIRKGYAGEKEEEVQNGRRGTLRQVRGAEKVRTVEAKKERPIEKERGFSKEEKEKGLRNLLRSIVGNSEGDPREIER
jgi:hypothetical protein